MRGRNEIQFAAKSEEKGSDRQYADSRSTGDEDQLTESPTSSSDIELSRFDVGNVMPQFGRDDP